MKTWVYRLIIIILILISTIIGIFEYKKQENELNIKKVSAKKIINNSCNLIRTAYLTYWYDKAFKSDSACKIVMETNINSSINILFSAQVVYRDVLSKEENEAISDIYTMIITYPTRIIYDREYIREIERNLQILDNKDFYLYLMANSDINSAFTRPWATARRKK